MQIKIILMVLLTIVISGCSYQITRNYPTPVSNHSVKDYNPVIFKKKDLFGLKFKYLGSAILNQNIQSGNYTEDKAIVKLMQEAYSLNADLVNIAKEIYSENSYSCLADFYRNESDEKSKAIDILRNSSRININYNEQNSIKWSDFKLQQPDSLAEPYEFISNIKILSNCQSFWTRAFKNFYVQGVFYSDISKVKSSFANDTNLPHIQLLYDLTNLYAKKLELYLNTHSFKAKNIGKIHDVYLLYLNDLYLEQKKYSTETEYGANKMAQQVWLDKITSELKKLEIKK
jgi:hypothetical protein